MCELVFVSDFFLSVIKFDSLLERHTVHFLLVHLNRFKPFFLLPPVVFVHLLQHLPALLFLLLFSFLESLIGLHLTLQELLSFQLFKLHAVQLLLLFTLDCVYTLRLLLHSLQSLLVLHVNFVSSNLVNQVLNALVLQSFLAHCLLVQTCLHLNLLV